MNSTAMRIAGVVASALLLSGATATAKPATGADLKVTATVDQPGPYVLAESIPITVTITNVGDAAATAVEGSLRALEDNKNFISAEWGDLGNFPPTVTIAAGATRVVKLAARVTTLLDPETRARITLKAARDANPSDNTADLSIRMVPTSATSTVTGVSYRDSNANGVFDKGEGFAGLRMTMYFYGGNRVTTTGEQ